MRDKERAADGMRPVRITRGFTRAAPGSVLFEAGETMVLCTASLAEEVPPWMIGQDRGWVTAEYGMLPGSTSPRKRRDRGGPVEGRTLEIQRLIGRSLRAAVDLAALGPRTITLDCDVLQADGGTRTACITAAFVALCEAITTIGERLPEPQRLPLTGSVAAVSVGLAEGEPLLDLDYAEDVAAAVDMNVVMTGDGRLVEVQGTGEGTTFTEEDLSAMLRLARKGIAELTGFQRTALGERWPLHSVSGR